MKRDLGIQAILVDLVHMKSPIEWVNEKTNQNLTKLKNSICLKLDTNDGLDKYIIINFTLIAYLTSWLCFSIFYREQGKAQGNQIHEIILYNHQSKMTDIIFNWAIC